MNGDGESRRKGERPKVTHVSAYLARLFAYLKIGRVSHTFMGVG